MLRKQIEGVLNLSFPLIILYNVYPIFLLTMPGQCICSLVIASYLYFVHYKQLQNLQNTLQFSPSGSHKDFFNNLMQECQVDPNLVILKYAYIADGIAMAAGKTVIIDPILWHGINDDPEAVKVEEIFKVHIQKGLTAVQKDRIEAFSKLLTPGSQRFIFKHELAHVVHNFSFKKLLVIFIIGFLSTYSGIIVAMLAMQIHGLVAILVGMFVGGFMDLLLMYVSNVVWKLQEEKTADRFAAQYSNNEDIQAAALFFKEHQHVVDTYKKSGNLLESLPSVILSGHQHGLVRSAYLLQLLSKN
jgi:hypothetical protein